jgi:hypothetical protein
MQSNKRTLLDEIMYYCFYSWYYWLKDRPREIRWFLQRGKRGFADCDIWDFDDYLIDVISAGLKQLKKVQQTCPTEIFDKYEHLSIEERDKATQKEWNEILDRIIEGFDAAKVLLDMYCELDEKERKDIEQIRQRGFDLFKEYFFNLWD